MDSIQSLLKVFFGSHMRDDERLILGVVFGIVGIAGFYTIWELFKCFILSRVEEHQTRSLSDDQIKMKYGASDAPGSWHVYRLNPSGVIREGEKQIGSLNQGLASLTEVELSLKRFTFYAGEIDVRVKEGQQQVRAWNWMGKDLETILDGQLYRITRSKDRIELQNSGVIVGFVATPDSYGPKLVVVGPECPPDVTALISFATKLKVFLRRALTP